METETPLVVRQPKAIVLEIHQIVISSKFSAVLRISFRRNLKSFLEQNWFDDSVQELIERLREVSGKSPAPPNKTVLPMKLQYTMDEICDSVCHYADWAAMQKPPVTNNPLKELRSAYMLYALENDNLKTTIYPDVAEQLQRWDKETNPKISLFTFSAEPTNINQLILLLRKNNEGDLGKYLKLTGICGIKSLFDEMRETFRKNGISLFDEDVIVVLADIDTARQMRQNTANIGIVLLIESQREYLKLAKKDQTEFAIIRSLNELTFSAAAPLLTSIGPPFGARFSDISTRNYRTL